MAKIYSSFSNPSGDLSQLQREFEGLFNFFNSNAIKKKVDYEFGMNATVDALTSKIIAGQKDIRLFHFSGHSGGSGLDFPKSQFTSDQISRFFNTICADQSKIDCVFLNGCENEDIVNQLKEVPVVIGTRSKIEDHLASKFTLDFFNALIKSECSYQQAFNDAKSAIIPATDVGDRTRGEGGSDEIENPGRLGEYFFKANDKKIAESKFPLKPKKTNWTKYIFLFLVVIASILVYFFWDEISLLIRGYTCSKTCFKDGTTCNIVIGDFAKSNDVKEVNRRILNKIDFDAILAQHIKIISIDSFGSLTHNGRFSRDKFPSLCDYDFNVTGNFSAEQAEFKIFPSSEGALLGKTYSYDVNSMGRKVTEDSKLTADNIEQILLFEMCVSCALKKENMSDIPSIALNIKEVLDSKGSIDFQRLYNRLADYYLITGDTTKAQTALHKVITSGANDFSLMAIERKISLYFSTHEIKKVFSTQSDLISEYQSRKDQPERFEIRGNLNDYTRGENTVRLERAKLVLKYKDDELKDYRQSALQDFQYLQSIKFNSRDYTEEINMFQDQATVSNVGSLPPHSVTPPLIKLEIDGKVINEARDPLSGASLQLGSLKASSNADGYFDFGSLTAAEFIGKILYISLKGYQKKEIKISGKSLGTITLIPLPTKKIITLQAILTDTGQFKKIHTYLLRDGYPVNDKLSVNFDHIPPSFLKSPSVIYYLESDQKDAEILAKRLHDWTGGNYEVHAGIGSPSIALSRSSINTDITIHLLGTLKMFRLQGTVYAKRDKTIPGAKIIFNGQQITTDKKGQFDFGEYSESYVLGKQLIISSKGFNTLKIQINEENTREIVLDPSKEITDTKFIDQHKNN